MGVQLRRMKDQLSIPVEPEVFAFLHAEAARRNLTAEELGLFAVNLFVHYEAEIRRNVAVILQPSSPFEAANPLLYASSVPRELAEQLDAIVHDDRTKSFRLRAAESPPPLHIVE